MEYRGIRLNRQQDFDGSYIRANEDETYLVEAVDFSGMLIRDQREGLNLDTGGIFGPATKVFRRISIRGSVRAPSPGRLEDMAVELTNAFDVEVAQGDSAGGLIERGVHPFDFITPSVVGVPGGVVGDPVIETFLCRPSQFPVTLNRRSTGNSMGFTLELLAADPRRYNFDLEGVTIDAAGAWTATLINWPVGMGIDTNPLVDIYMLGAGDADFTITDTAGNAFVLDLSGQLNGEIISVDMQNPYTIFRSEVDPAVLLPQIRVSDVDSFLSVPAGGTTWTLTNTTNVDRVEVVYRQARS